MKINKKAYQNMSPEDRSLFKSNVLAKFAKCLNQGMTDGEAQLLVAKELDASYTLVMEITPSKYGGLRDKYNMNLNRKQWMKR